MRFSGNKILMPFADADRVRRIAKLAPDRRRIIARLVNPAISSYRGGVTIPARGGISAIQNVKSVCYARLTAPSAIIM